PVVQRLPGVEPGIRQLLEAAHAGAGALRRAVFPDHVAPALRKLPEDQPAQPVHGSPRHLVVMPILEHHHRALGPTLDRAEADAFLDRGRSPHGGCGAQREEKNALSDYSSMDLHRRGLPQTAGPTEVPIARARALVEARGAKRYSRLMRGGWLHAT